MPKFYCEFYIASKPYKESLRNFEECFISEWSIGTLGSLYSEKHILGLGRHYTPYLNKGGKWNIVNFHFGSSIGSYSKRDEKVRSSDVSGNIGEVISIKALTACIGKPMNVLPFHRFTSVNKCPDYRIQINPKILSELWDIPEYILSKIINIPSEITMEVKTTFKYEKPHKYPYSAIFQLRRFWEECDKVGYKDMVGFGILARVLLNYKIPVIRYYLYIPKLSSEINKYNRFSCETIRDYPRIFFAEVQ